MIPEEVDRLNCRERNHGIEGRVLSEIGDICP